MLEKFSGYGDYTPVSISHETLKAAVKPMTPEERFEQRVSFVFGQLSHTSTITKDQVREILKMENSK